jgi:hypothetical protein
MPATARQRTVRKGFVRLEERAPLGRSLIWSLQAQYFAERGAEAWRSGEVPQYVTTNVHIANAYAEMVLAFRRDLERLAPAAAAREPLTICELGAGSGRFAFHFLEQLCRLCSERGSSPGRFRYLLTDSAAANLAWWRSHPSFARHFETGLLDVATFDLMRPSALAPERSGRTIGLGDLGLPLVGIANYVLDSVPQDVFRFRRGGAAQSVVSLEAEAGVDLNDAPGLLAALQVTHEEAGLLAPPFDEPEYRELFDCYRRSIADSWVPFPADALRGLSGLASLSRQGLFLLSADRGAYDLETLEGRRDPGLARHGSVSLPVNYHALAHLCEQGGGEALLPERAPHSIVVVGLLMVPAAGEYGETRDAYRRQVQDFGPDDFFALTRDILPQIPELSARAIIDHVQASLYDAVQFGRALPRLIELAHDMDDDMRARLREIADAVWTSYFPLGEACDLANDIGRLLYAMNDYAGALAYFERGIALYGADTGTLYNMACCRHLLGQDAEAAAMLDRVVRHDPRNEDAKALREVCVAAAEGTRSAKLMRIQRS